MAGIQFMSGPGRISQVFLFLAQSQEPRVTVGPDNILSDIIPISSRDNIGREIKMILSRFRRKT